MLSHQTNGWSRVADKPRWFRVTIHPPGETVHQHPYSARIHNQDNDKEDSDGDCCSSPCRRRRCRGRVFNNHENDVEIILIITVLDVCERYGKIRNRSVFVLGPIDALGRYNVCGVL